MGLRDETAGFKMVEQRKNDHSATKMSGFPGNFVGFLWFFMNFPGISLVFHRTPMGFLRLARGHVAPSEGQVAAESRRAWATSEMMVVG